MGGILVEIGVVVGLVLLGGTYSAADAALLSIRDSHARGLVERGHRGAVVATLHEDPDRFRTPVTICLTLCGRGGKCAGHAGGAVTSAGRGSRSPPA